MVNKDSAHPRVCILLSTYNGQRYLGELLQSISSQDYENWLLYVRDDGSTDDSLSILKEAQRQDSRILVNPEENVGIVESFLRLLAVDVEADIFALCDQDDIWYRHKLSCVVEAWCSSDNAKPTLFVSSFDRVDRSGRPLSTRKVSKSPSFPNSLVENIGPGCCMALNRVGRELVVKRDPDVQRIRMHDAWIYSIISGHGKVVYDRRKLIAYRQHGSNAVGSARGYRRLIKRIFRVRRRSRDRLLLQARELLAQYRLTLPSEEIAVLRRFVVEAGSSSIRVRLKYVWSGEAARRNWLDNVIFRVFLLCGIC